MRVTIRIEAGRLGDVTITREVLEPPPPPLHEDPNSAEQWLARRRNLASLLDHAYAQVADAYRLVDMS